MIADSFESRILGLAISVVLFLVAAFFSRAGWRRVFGAFVSSCIIFVYVMLIDKMAAKLNLWYYPTYITSNAPIEWYITLGLAYGGALGLLGWRVLRRFGINGFIIFAVIVALYGIARDYYVSSFGNILIFPSGLCSWLADFTSYASAAILTQIIMMVITGKPGSDKFARIKKK